jgi:hypothetical protein
LQGFDLLILVLFNLSSALSTAIFKGFFEVSLLLRRLLLQLAIDSLARSLIPLKDFTEIFTVLGLSQLVLK